MYERLYPGKTQLETSLQALVTGAEAVLELTRPRRERTVVRVDGGGGRQADINWLLSNGYGVLAKVHNWQRSRKLARSVSTWLADSKEAGRQVGWVETPHGYDQATYQVAIRKPTDKGWQYAVLVTNLPPAALFWLARQPSRTQPTQADLLWAILYAYDKRGGGVETSFKQSKQGLHLHKRNKRGFVAQQMLLLVAQLGHNLLLWARLALAKHSPQFQSYGLKRLVRDVGHIPGLLTLNPDGKVIGIVFSRPHPLADRFVRAVRDLLPASHVLLSLYEI